MKSLTTENEVVATKNEVLTTEYEVQNWSPRQLKMKSRTTENEVWIWSPWQPKMKSLATENVYHRKLNKVLSPPMYIDIWDLIRLIPVQKVMQN